MVNETLWDIEDEIRVCERNRDFGDRFVRLARDTYLTNDRRGAVKARIDALVGSVHTEVKEYARY